MLKSMEQIAKEKLEQYLRPLVLDGEKIMDGWLYIAAKKAVAAYPNFEKEIMKIASEMAKA